MTNSDRNYYLSGGKRGRYAKGHSGLVGSTPKYKTVGLHTVALSKGSMSRKSPNAVKRFGRKKR